jgi:hypothetical protein
MKTFLLISYAKDEDGRAICDLTSFYHTDSIIYHTSYKSRDELESKLKSLGFTFKETGYVLTKGDRPGDSEFWVDPTDERRYEILEISSWPAIEEDKHESRQ